MTKKQRKAEFETVCSTDPELLKSAIPIEDMVAFWKDRDLTRIEPAVIGGKPAKYLVREIPHALWDYVDRGETQNEKFKRAFMCGVVQVADLWQRNGTSLPLITGSRVEKIGGSQVNVFSDEDMAQFFPSAWLEIGSVAYAHSFLDLRTIEAFQLPPTLLSRHPDSDYRRAG